MDHRWRRVRRRRSPNASRLGPRPPRPGARRWRQAIRQANRQQSHALANCHRQGRRPGTMAGRFAGSGIPAVKSFPLIARRGAKRSNIPGATGPFTAAAPTPRLIPSRGFGLSRTLARKFSPAVHHSLWASPRQNFVAGRSPGRSNCFLAHDFRTLGTPLGTPAVPNSSPNAAPLSLLFIPPECRRERLRGRLRLVEWKMISIKTISKNEKGPKPSSPWARHCGGRGRRKRAPAGGGGGGASGRVIKARMGFLRRKVV